MFIFVSWLNGNLLSFFLYVNDILIGGHESKMIDKLNEEMLDIFDNNDLGPAQ